MKNSRRFVAKAEAGNGWRIWDRKMKKWWGQRYKHRPDQIVDELNGQKRPDMLVELQRKYKDDRIL